MSAGKSPEAYIIDESASG